MAKFPPDPARENEIYFRGHYSCWSEAIQDGHFYDTQDKFDKILKAAIKVRDGQAAASRQGILLGEIPHSFPLIAAALFAASRNLLSVLDFGGSLGTHYFHNRAFFSHLSRLSWSVVELDDIVQAGNHHLADNQLRFYPSIKDCLRHQPKPNLIVISGVLAYLENPWIILAELLDADASYLFIDRTALIDSLRDRLTIQHVPAYIYRSDHPSWFLSERKFLNALQSAHYQTLRKLPQAEHYNLPDANVFFRGFICCKDSTLQSTF
jgi:putative methyltransferase (TIGR04325 family)